MGRSWKYTLYMCFGLLGYALPASAQSSDQVIVTVNGQSFRLLGFIATGPKPDLDRLVGMAETHHLTGRELPGPDGLEAMIVFQPGSDPKTAMEFLALAKSTEFSALKVSEINAPVEH